MMAFKTGLCFVALVLWFGHVSNAEPTITPEYIMEQCYKDGSDYECVLDENGDTAVFRRQDA